MNLLTQIIHYITLKYIKISKKKKNIIKLVDSANKLQKTSMIIINFYP